MSLEWSDSGVEGAARFLKRLWRLIEAHVAQGPAPALQAAELDEAQRALRRQVHETLRKVDDDLGRRYTFNTAIAAVMELSNALSRSTDTSPQGRAVMQEALTLSVLMLAPIVPHICHVLWQQLGHAGAIIDEPWPQPDADALMRAEIDWWCRSMVNCAGASGCRWMLRARPSSRPPCTNPTSPVSWRTSRCAR